MDLPHMKKFVNYTSNQTDICQGQCYSTEDLYYCQSDCFVYCISNCPNKISPVPPSSSPHHKLPPKFFIAGLVPGITLLVLFCLIIYYKFYTGPRGRAPEEQRNETHEEFLDEDHGPVLDHPIWYVNTVGLQPSVINSITIYKFKKGDGVVEGTDCSVCLNEFQEDETLRLLPKCSHAFHVPCIDTWLRSHTNCPMCRAPIVAANPETAASYSGTGSGGDGGVGGEETRIGFEENTEESDRGIGGGDAELRVEIEEGELQDENRRERGEEEGIQPIRRSVSLDSLSAFRISQALANIHSRESDRNSDTGLVKESESNMGIAPKRVGSSSNQSLLKFMASSSIGRSLQIGPSTLKRSLSCGGKLFLQRYSRNSSSVLPL